MYLGYATILDDRVELLIHDAGQIIGHLLNASSFKVYKEDKIQRHIRSREAGPMYLIARWSETRT